MQLYCILSDAVYLSATCRKDDYELYLSVAYVDVLGLVNTSINVRLECVFKF